MKYNLSVQKSNEIYMYICFDSRARTSNSIVIGRTKSPIKWTKRARACTLSCSSSKQRDAILLVYWTDCRFFREVLYKWKKWPVIKFKILELFLKNSR